MQTKRTSMLDVRWKVLEIEKNSNINEFKKERLSFLRTFTHCSFQVIREYTVRLCPLRPGQLLHTAEHI